MGAPVVPTEEGPMYPIIPRQALQNLLFGQEVGHDVLQGPPVRDGNVPVILTLVPLDAVNGVVQEGGDRPGELVAAEDPLLVLGVDTLGLLDAVPIEGPNEGVELFPGVREDVQEVLYGLSACKIFKKSTKESGISTPPCFVEDDRELTRFGFADFAEVDDGNGVDAKLPRRFPAVLPVDDLEITAKVSGENWIDEPEGPDGSEFFLIDERILSVRIIVVGMHPRPWYILHYQWPIGGHKRFLGMYRTRCRRR